MNEVATDARVRDLEQQLERERRKLELTLEVGRALAPSSDRQHLYSRIIENITEIMDADRSTLYLLDRDSGELVSRVSQGGEEAPVIRLRLGEGIAGSAAQLGEIVRVEDAYGDVRFDPSVDERTGYRTRTVMCAPLIDSVGATMGVIQVLNKRRGPFSEEDEELIAALAGQVSIAVENASLHHETLENNLALMATSERLRKQTSDIGVLLQLEREVSAALSPQDIYDRLLRSAMDLVGARSGSIALLVGDGRLLRFETVAGPHADLIRGRRIAMGDGIIGWVAKQRESVIVNTPADDPRHHRGFAADVGESPECLICVPLVSEGRVLGALELIDRVGGFTAEHLQLVELIASQVARAVETARRRLERDEEERLATVGEMMAGVLHDLRTPMTVISGYTELMALPGQASARVDYGKLIQRQFDIMNGMIGEILAFARGDSQLLVTAFHLNSFFEQVDTQLRKDLASKGVTLRFETGYGSEVRADRVKLLRLIANLANNACEAMAGQGDSGTFVIRSRRDGDVLELEFEDDGPGIPDELEGRLFDAFASGRAGGTGLGLAIVKRIVDQHGGDISVDSQRGRGTRFRVRLPLPGPPGPASE